MSTHRPPTASPHRLGRPLGTGRDWRRRLLVHHVPLALSCAAALVLFLDLSPRPGGGPRGSGMGGQGMPQEAGGVSLSLLTTASGYVATGLLGMTLLIGPANLLFRRHNPVSTSLARDTGTWAAIYSVIHVIIGLQPHGGTGLSGVLDYFIARDGSVLLNSFGLGNWTGLAALVIVVGLLAISTDRCLRELKAKRWKNLQRLNYALFALVIAHALFYGALLRMTSPFTLLLIVIAGAVLAGQLAGILLWRRRQADSARYQHERQQAKAPH
jgi:sulfoxide reductase heme-binding subunit YedZ